MKITFPHMGNQYIASKALLNDLGKEVIVPPRCSKRTLELGTKYSPETICLPLKINIGNYIESIEKGADTILITGSCGPCRFGYYHVIEKQILKDMGYDVNIIPLDPPDGSLKKYTREVLNKISIVDTYRIVKSLIKAKKVLKKCDELTDICNYKRARGKNSLLVDDYMNKFHNEISNTSGVKNITRLIDNTKHKIEKIEEYEHRDTLKVGIIGEIYTIIEPFVNLEIERKLGHMGVEVKRSITPTSWIEHHLGLGQIGMSDERKKWKAAKPYLSTLVGGHGRETVGSAVIYAEEGVDGIIQIFPLNCMPEIVAESILPSIQRDYDIPILSLIVDEMTGEAGYLTRLEAFVDLLKKRKEEKNNEPILLRS